jgi:hypothetical protein
MHMVCNFFRHESSELPRILYDSLELGVDNFNSSSDPENCSKRFLIETDLFKQFLELSYSKNNCSVLGTAFPKTEQTFFGQLSTEN